MVQKSTGLTFTRVLGTPEALVSYFKWFGGQPDGKQDSRLMVNVPDPSLAGTIKGGFKSKHFILNTISAYS